MKSLARFGAVFSAVAVLSACAGIGAGRLPAVTVGTQTHTPGRIVWCDLLSDDVETASAFYGSLFGWEYVSFAQQPLFRVAYAGKRPVAGLTAHRSPEGSSMESLWVCSVSVDDVDETSALAKAQGATLIEPPWDAAPRGRVAVIGDPLEAPLALIRTDSGDPSPRIPVGGWSWFDYFATDPDVARAFYEAVLGYRVADSSEDGRTAQLLGVGGETLRASIVDVGDLPIESNWLAYVRVNDLAGTLSKVESLGGRVLLVVNDAAVIEDPSGAAIGVHGPWQGVREKGVPQ